MKKVITWVDPEGRYRVTSPSYGDRTNPSGETEDETIARVTAKLKIRYGLPNTHVFHEVEDAVQRTRVLDLAGTYFRYGVFDTDARAGAWEMDVDGRPKVNMAKARVVHMDSIRVARNTGLAKLDTDYIRADETNDPAEKARVGTEKQTLRDIPQTFDLTAFTTPNTLKAAWPTELLEFK